MPQDPSMRSESPEPDADDRVLASFGYRQELRRALRTFSLFAVAFSIISITTGLFTNFGFGLSHLGPAFIWLWPVAALGQLPVALVVSELGSRIPLAGYSYQWGARLVGPAYGWFVGFTGLAYLSVGGAAINYVVLAPIVATILGLDAGSPPVLLAITIAAFAACLVINLISVTLAARINNAAVFTEIVGTLVVALVLAGLWAARPTHPLGFLLDTGGVRGLDLLRQLPFAALIGIFTLVGFELAADLSEEVVQARLTVPRAVVSSLLVAAAVGMVTLIGFTLAIPDLHAVASSPVPLADIVEHWLGRGLTGAFLVVVVFSIFALNVVGTAATARLIFAMARDDILPFSRTLRRVPERTRTPIPALLSTTGLSLLFVLFGFVDGARFGGSAFLLLVTAAATLPYVVYLLTVLAYAGRRRRLPPPPGAFTLGVWSTPVMYAALAWIVLVLLVLTLPLPYLGADAVVAGVEVVALAWYVLALRSRLRRPEA